MNLRVDCEDVTVSKIISTLKIEMSNIDTDDLDRDDVAECISDEKLINALESRGYTVER